MGEPLRLGMLGMWHTHAAGIVRQAAARPEEFLLSGFWDPDPATAAARRAEWEPLVPGFRLFDAPEALLEQPLDGVVVEGQVYHNLDLARMALESGRPVLLEKPAGCDGEAFRRLVRLARRQGLHLQMLYLFRYMAAVQEMVRRARSGELGEIYLFRARLPKDLALYAHHVREFGWHAGGIFFEMAGHAIDLMAAVLGPPASVTPFLAHHGRREGAFVDNGLAVFGFERAWGVIEVPALEAAPGARRIEVFGTGGACVIPHLGSGHLENEPVQPLDVFRAGEKEWRRLDLPAAALQIRDLREFAAVVRGEKAPDFSPEHDLAVQEALLRACERPGG